MLWNARVHIEGTAEKKAGTVRGITRGVLSEHWSIFYGTVDCCTIHFTLTRGRVRLTHHSHVLCLCAAVHFSRQIEPLEGGHRGGILLSNITAFDGNLTQPWSLDSGGMTRPVPSYFSRTKSAPNRPLSFWITVLVLQHFRQKKALMFFYSNSQECTILQMQCRIYSFLVWFPWLLLATAGERGHFEANDREDLQGQRNGDGQCWPRYQ